MGLSRCCQGESLSPILPFRASVQLRNSPGSHHCSPWTRCARSLPDAALILARYFPILALFALLTPDRIPDRRRYENVGAPHSAEEGGRTAPRSAA